MPSVPWWQKSVWAIWEGTRRKLARLTAHAQPSTKNQVRGESYRVDPCRVCVVVNELMLWRRAEHLGVKPSRIADVGEQGRYFVLCAAQPSPTPKGGRTSRKLGCLRCTGTGFDLRTTTLVPDFGDHAAYSVQNQFERFRGFLELIRRFEFELRRRENYIF